MADLLEEGVGALGSAEDTAAPRPGLRGWPVAGAAAPGEGAASRGRND